MEFNKSQDSNGQRPAAPKIYSDSIATETPIFLTPGYMGDKMSQQSMRKPERRFTYQGKDISELSDSVLETMDMDNLLTAVEELRENS